MRDQWSIPPFVPSPPLVWPVSIRNHSAARGRSRRPSASQPFTSFKDIFFPFLGFSDLFCPVPTRILNCGDRPFSNIPHLSFSRVVRFLLFFSVPLRDKIPQKVEAASPSFLHRSPLRFPGTPLFIEVIHPFPPIRSLHFSPHFFPAPSNGFFDSDQAFSSSPFALNSSASLAFPPVSTAKK